MKILICGDVDGKFDKLFERVSQIIKGTTDFECLFCVGRFFSSSTSNGAFGEAAAEYLSGMKPVPLLTYFIVANSSEVDLADEGCEICENLVYLGNSGIKNIHGLHVAYVSGCYDKYVQDAGISTSSAYTQRSIKQVVIQAGHSEFGRMIDLLLTSEWPKNVLSTVSEPVMFEGGSTQIALLAKHLQPRYHFSANENLFYQRLPYKNEDTPYATRFLGLAGISDSQEKHKKWLYAMNIVPLKDLGFEKSKETTAAVTDNPFQEENIQKKIQQNTALLKRQREEEETRKQGQKKTFVDQQCWFCIDKVKPDARHLIVSHGDFTYLSLTKGGLMDYHLLIVPMEHHTGTNVIHGGMETEINQYIGALTEFFQARGEFLVYYERNIYTHTPMHMNLQVFGVGSDVCTPDYIKEVLLGKAVDLGLAFDSYEDSEPLPEQFFLLHLPGEALIYKHLAKKKGYTKFDMQFGRNVMCRALKLDPKFSDWHQCVKSTTAEEQIAERFKLEFKPYDWSLKRSQTKK